MSVEQMRDKISKVYDSWRWRNRVSSMPNKQVIAIYHSFENQGKFKKPKPTGIPSETRYTQCRQMTIFDYIPR